MIKKFLLILLCGLNLKGDETISLFMPVPASGSEGALEMRRSLYTHLNKFLDWMMSFTHLEYVIDSPGVYFEQGPGVLALFEKEHGFFSSIHPLVGQYTPLKEDIQTVEKTLLSIDKLAIKPYERLFYIQEILSKVLAYRALDLGDEITLPDFEISGQSVIYRVERVFNLGLGMPCFALSAQASDKSSILLYRGTHLDMTDISGVASVIADLDLFGPGYTAFFKSKDQIEAFLISEQLNHKKCAVLGFSLGGVLSCYSALFLSDYIDFVHSAAFNPPGVQKKMVALCEKSQKLKEFTVYVNQNDPVSKWGFLVGNVKVLSLNQRMGPLKAHTYLMGSGERLQVNLCNQFLENNRHRYLFLPE